MDERETQRRQRVRRILGWILTFPLLVSIPVGGFGQSNKSNRNMAAIADEIVYRGACDASAAVAIDTNLVVVASDEDSRLRIYDRERGGLPLQTFDLIPHLHLGRGSAETDIEGAARLGHRIYWVTSHALNNQGERRPNRHRFFATEFRVSHGQVQMSVPGRAYMNLVSDLANAPGLTRFGFAAASQRQPKARGALNIEGLCATPEHELLIGFRNPVPDGQALLVALKNPDQVVAGQRPRFGEPVLLDLGGLGIRDIAYHEGRYVIVGGPFDGRGREKLFSWAGGERKPKAIKNAQLKELNLEAVAIYPDKGLHEFQLFCDDSSQRVGRKDCSDLQDPLARQFRSVWIEQETE